MDGEEQSVPAVAATSGPRLWIVLARAYRAMAEVLEQGIASEGLCLSDFMVMEVLLHAKDGKDGALPISTIGAKIQLANASMTSAVDRLHELGLVVRCVSDADGRVRLVRLTETGRRLIEAVYAQHEREIDELMVGISPDERTQMREGLRTMGLKAREVAQTRAKERREQGRGGCGSGQTETGKEPCPSTVRRA